jgi:citrate lyase alpha subunit
MRGMGVLRSHGGRWQAIQDGEVHIDIAVIAAPTADPFGNANGDRKARRPAARSTSPWPTRSTPTR